MKNEKLKMENLMHKNEEQTRRVANALKSGNERGLLDAMRKGQQSLEGMGVVSGKVMPLIRSIEAHGGAAKILGGGGRVGPVGFLLCYHHKPRLIEQLCKPYGYTLQPIVLGSEGVRLEK